jgi:hypothetical protein
MKKDIFLDVARVAFERIGVSEEISPSIFRVKRICVRKNVSSN